MSRIEIDLARAVYEVEALMRAHPDLAEDEQFRADMIEGATCAEDVIRRLVLLREEAIGAAEAVAAHAAALKQRKERHERRAEAARDGIARILEAASLMRLTLPDLTLSFGRSPAKAILTDEKTLPDAYWRVKREPDLTRIRQALQAGEEVPGATLSNGGYTLRIART